MKKTVAVVIVAAFLLFAGSARAYTEIGNTTLFGDGAGHDNSGVNNSFFGYTAGYHSTGTQNSFFGSGAGYSNTTGYSNTLIGYDAGYYNTQGQRNVFVGNQAGSANVNGSFNTFIGMLSGQASSGTYNSFLGYSSGYNTSSGYRNTIVGAEAGFTNTTGHGNVFLGFSAGSEETGSNKLYIDNCYLNSGSPNFYCDSPLIKGDFQNRWVQVDGALSVTSYATPSDLRLKKDIEPLQSSLDKVTKLKGVSYSWKTDENPGRGFKTSRDIGLIAQDVEAVIPEVVSTDGAGYKALSYDKLVPVLVEAIKEQQVVIKQQEKQNAEKDVRIEKQEKALDTLSAIIARLEVKVNRLESKGMSAQK